MKANITCTVFKTGAESEIATRWNKRSWAAIRFRPRVLVPVSQIDISASIFGNRFSAPFFIAPAGGGKFSNRQGEVLWTRAADRHKILQWVCNNAGCSQGEMADERAQGQVLYWQIYAMKDLETTKKEIQEAVALGYRGFALTVDAIHVGKRERDMRMNIAERVSIEIIGTNEHNHSLEQECDLESDEDESPAGSISVSRPYVTIIIPSDDVHGEDKTNIVGSACYELFDFPSAIKWLRSLTDLPIAIKGVQSWEDAQLCMHYGVHPWLSNHGGRQLDSAPSAAETLVEIRQNCPQVFEACEVIVDGGITRGADVVKAIALGAKGVAVGRSFLFSLALGDEGLDKAIRILKQEVEAAMGLIGVASISELRPCHVSVVLP